MSVAAVSSPMHTQEYQTFLGTCLRALDSQWGQKVEVAGASDNFGHDSIVLVVTVVASTGRRSWVVHHKEGLGKPLHLKACNNDIYSEFWTSNIYCN